MVKSTPPHAVIAEVSTTTPKMSVFFNQSAEIKAGYFGKSKFVNRQRDHHETFRKHPTIFSSKPTKQEKTMSEEELYAFSELCMFEIFIHIIRNF